MEIEERPDQGAGLDEAGSKKSPIHAAVAKPTSSARGPAGASPRSNPAPWPKPIGRRLRLRIRQIFAHPEGPAAVAEAMGRMPEPFTLADVMKAFHRAAYKLGIPRPEFGTRPKQSRNQEQAAEKK